MSKGEELASRMHFVCYETVNKYPDAGLSLMPYALDILIRNYGIDVGAKFFERVKTTIEIADCLIVS